MTYHRRAAALADPLIVLAAERRHLRSIAQHSPFYLGVARAKYRRAKARAMSPVKVPA